MQDESRIRGAFCFQSLTGLVKLRVRDPILYSRNTSRPETPGSALPHTSSLRQTGNIAEGVVYE